MSDTSQSQPRLAYLDYLRGFCALGIMIYHYDFWVKTMTSQTVGDASTFLGKVGIYGVSIFYILSGLTLFQIYQSKIQINYNSIQKFFIKRIFRIFPLLWIILIATIILNRNHIYETKTLFLNFTGLFGFIDWNNYIATGIWSIGNELVFYALFPLFCIFSKQNKVMFYFISLIILTLFIYFSFFRLNTLTDLSSQWRDYINPLNQVSLFFGGFLIGLFLRRKERRKGNCLLFLIIIASLLLFIFYPVSGNQIHIVVGWNRVVFTLLCFCICACFYKLSVNLPKFIHFPLYKLGEATYSIYLVHPLVWGVALRITRRFFDINIGFVMVISIILTIVVSLAIYRFFEKRFMNLGNQIIKNI